MDTVEAGIQVQNRKLNEQQALLNLQNAAQFLSVFLWADGRIPLELQECAIPVSADSLGIQLPDLTARDSLISSHPMLTQAAFKIDRLDIDRRLKREKLRLFRAQCGGLRNRTRVQDAHLPAWGPRRCSNGRTQDRGGATGLWQQAQPARL
jgi:hypothetical protein